MYKKNTWDWTALKYATNTWDWTALKYLTNNWDWTALKYVKNTWDWTPLKYVKNTWDWTPLKYVKIPGTGLLQGRGRGGREDPKWRWTSSSVLSKTVSSFFLFLFCAA